MVNKELEANTNLSHYRIVAKIGAGGWARFIEQGVHELDFPDRLPASSKDRMRDRISNSRGKWTQACTHHLIAIL
jgi:hypothetical protein